MAILKEKVLLSLFRVAGASLSKAYVQKILFLASLEKGLNLWSFVPYKYGPYSFSLSQYLEKHPLFTVSGDRIRLSGNVKHDSRLLSELGNSLSDLVKRFPPDKVDFLIGYVCKNYIPALHLRPSCKDDIALFTIGYEGLSIEDFIWLLVQNRVEVLVDIRSWPHSRKFGFSRNFLEQNLSFWGIQYYSFLSTMALLHITTRRRLV